MHLPSNIEELITLWKAKLAELTQDNNEQIAYDIVGSLAGNDSLWDEWYASGKDTNVEKVFDNAADLELPNGINVKNAREREVRWNVVKTCVEELDNMYLKPKRG